MATKRQTAEAKRTDDRQGEGRKRRPLGTVEQRLRLEAKDGFVRRFINDDRNRLELAQKGGWEFVTNDKGEKIQEVVGSKEGGQPLYAFAMEIREDWYNEDQAKKQAELDKTDEAIRRGRIMGATDADARNERFYPGSDRGGIVYETSTG